MESDKNLIPTSEAMKDYNPKDRDFLGTEEDLDNISKSEKEALEEEKSKKEENK